MIAFHQMANLQQILQELTGDLEPVARLAQRFVEQDSLVDPISGGAFLSHRPRIALQAYALRIYAGIDDSTLAEYEDIHGLTICSTYRAVLRKMNGASLFEISLFGLPISMTKRPPLLDRSTAWPFDVATAQKNWSLPYNVPCDCFFMGYGPHSDKEHLGYFIVPGDGIVAMLKGGEKVERWPSIRSFLEHELARAEAAYPKY